jgi:hypothetical protein
MEREVARRLNAIKKRKYIDCMMKEIKIETLQRQSSSENESLYSFVDSKGNCRMHDGQARK